MPQDSLFLEMETSGILTAGEDFAVEAIAIKQHEGLSNEPSLTWVGEDGAPVEEGGGISLSSMGMQLQFRPLYTSHAQVYSAVATLESPALHEPLVKSEDFVLSVQSEYCKFNPLTAEGIYIYMHFTNSLMRYRTSF